MSSILHNLYNVDEQKATNGVRFVVATTSDGKDVAFWLRNAGKANKEYAKCLKRTLAPYQAQFNAKALADDVAEDLLKKVFCESIIVGWENVTDQFGDELPFTPDHAYKLMTELEQLYEILDEKSKDMAAFRIEQREASAKN